jgi:hypothetical protein
MVINMTNHSSFSSSKMDLKYPTSHLSRFDDLFDATGLSGDEYIPIIKTVWYSLLSTLISKRKLVLGIFRWYCFIF